MAGDYRPPVFHSQIEILSPKKTANSSLKKTQISLPKKNANSLPKKNANSLSEKKRKFPSRKNCILYPARFLVSYLFFATEKYKMANDNAPLVGIMMGSENDWPVMQKAAEILRDFGIPFETRVISAHRTPDLFFEYASSLKERGVRVMIGGAGGAAHLPGVLAAKTTLPVLGVPIDATPLRGMDSLLAIVQMPRGIPVATFAVGEPGAANAALFAVAILAGTDSAMAEKLKNFRAKMAGKIKNTPPPELPQ